ncbi:alpha-amylase family glycosyl hydrolase [Trichothermofontia sp.]
MTMTSSPVADLTAVRAAAGFLADETAPTIEAGFEFLFTRSLEFRQETIYFIIVDRFHDGNPANNVGPNPDLFDPTRQHWGKYWGGDLQGIIDKLDYLKALGITAIWVSPLFEQVEHLQFDRAAMHGYWTKDFKRINPRFLGADEDNSLFSCTVFDTLITEMHKRGMKLILDIVCNHSSPDVNGHKGELYDDGKLIADFYNDVNHWYHHNPEITDWENPEQMLYYELCGLATFNESNPDYRHYIKTAIKQWLDRGVDALRVDTVKHMPLWFWQEFMADIQTHKPSVFAFGEWGFSKPQNRQSTEFANRSGMSILDFGLCDAIREALAWDAPGGFERVQAVFDQDQVYDTASELVTFVDNHDMQRFLSLNPDGDRLRLAIGLIMTCRGIPCIYYGTEQYLYDNTQGGNDPYNRPMMTRWDTDTPLFKDIQQFSKLRRLNPAVSLGNQQQKYVSQDVFCFVRRYRDSRCFVAMNKGNPTTIDIPHTDLQDGEYFCMVTKRRFDVQKGALRGLSLGHHEMVVLSDIGDRVKGKTIVRAQLNGVSTQMGERIVVVGDRPELGNWDIAHAYHLEYINPNTWFGEIPFTESAGKAITYKYAIQRDGQAPIYENLVCRRWILAPAGTVKWKDTWCS